MHLLLTVLTSVYMHIDDVMFDIKKLKNNSIKRNMIVEDDNLASYILVGFDCADTNELQSINNYISGTFGTIKNLHSHNVYAKLGDINSDNIYQIYTDSIIKNIAISTKKVKENYKIYDEKDTTIKYVYRPAKSNLHFKENIKGVNDHQISFITNINTSNEAIDYLKTFIVPLTKKLISKTVNSFAIFYIYDDHDKTMSIKEKTHVDTQTAMKFDVFLVFTNLQSIKNQTSVTEPKCNKNTIGNNVVYIPQYLGVYTNKNRLEYYDKYGFFSILQLDKNISYEYKFINTYKYKEVTCYMISLGSYHNIKTLYVTTFVFKQNKQTYIKFVICKSAKKMQKDCNQSKATQSNLKSILKQAKTAEYLTKQVEKHKNKYDKKKVRFTDEDNEKNGNDQEINKSVGMNNKETTNEDKSKHFATESQNKRTIDDENDKKANLIDENMQFTLIYQHTYNANLQMHTKYVKNKLLYKTDNYRRKRLSFFSNFVANQNIYYKINLHLLPNIDVPELQAYTDNIKSKITIRNIKPKNIESTINNDHTRLKKKYINCSIIEIEYVFDSLIDEYEQIKFNDDFIYKCKVLKTNRNNNSEKKACLYLLSYNNKGRTRSLIIRYNYIHSVLKTYKDVGLFSNTNKKPGEKHLIEIQMHTNLLLARRMQIIGLGKEILEYFVNINNTHLTITLCMSPKHRQCFYKLIYYLNIADEDRNIIRKINVQNKYKITLPTENTYSSDYLSLTYIKTITTILSDEFQDYPYKSKYMDVINAYYEDLNKILLHKNITNKIALTTHITPFTAKSVTDKEYIEICKIFSNQ